MDGGASPKVRVRGLRAPQAAPVHLCRHCGTPLTTDRMRESGFCCTGCAYVFRLVHEHGLEGYYKIRDTVVAPVDQVVFQPRDYAWLVELQAGAEKSPGTPELMLEVQGPRREFLLPWRPEFVRTVLRDARVVVVAPPEGLVDG